MRWHCAAAFWDLVRSANTCKKSRCWQGLQQFVYSGWVKWHLAGWISGECNKHSPQQTFATTTSRLSPPSQQEHLQDSSSRCSSSSLWYGEFFWPFPAPTSTMHREGTPSRPRLCLLSVLSPWVVSSSACLFWKKPRLGVYKCLHFQAMPGSQVRFDTCLNPKLYTRECSQLAPFLSIKTKYTFAFVSVACLDP